MTESRLEQWEPWAQMLGEVGARALAHGLEATSFTLEHIRWFNLGRSGSPVALVVRKDGSAHDQLVLKFVDPPHVNQKVLSLREAWNKSDPQFRQRHLVEVVEPVVQAGRSSAVFQRLAYGELSASRPLEDLLGMKGFRKACQVIMQSVIAEWNDNSWEISSDPRLVTVGAVLGAMVGRKERRDTAVAWVHRYGPDLGGTNPADLLTGPESGTELRKLLIGRAHGDLNARNILVSGKPGDYVLIDYDRFRLNAPLARDPMHLLVTLALDEWQYLAPALRDELITVFVDPRDRAASERVRYYRAVSAATRDACTSSARGSGFVTEWNQQCLLGLVAGALLHIGRDLKKNRKLTAGQEREAKVWCYRLAQAAAERYRREAKPAPVVAKPRPSGRGGRASRQQMVDRVAESELLSRRLTDGPPGVTVLRGARGVGKSVLLDRVLHERWIGAPTVVPHEVTAHCRLDLRTLTGYLEKVLRGGVKQERPAAPASFVALENALDELGERPVVIAVDGAEHLLDPRSGRLADVDLDEALEMIDQHPDHRVVVLLATRRELISPGHRFWQRHGAEFGLDRLEPPAFLEFLEVIDPDDMLGVRRSDKRWQGHFWAGVQGNPRNAELLFATKFLDDRLNVRRFIEGLLTGPADDVPDTIVRALLDCLTETRTAVLEAVAALNTPVEAATIVALGPESEDPETLTDALSWLEARRVVYRSEDRRYWLPEDDADVVLERMAERADGAGQRVDLLCRAANRLTKLRTRKPAEVGDLRIHFAELGALLRAGQWRSAYSVVEGIDRIVGPWNARHLLLEQRTTLHEQLGDAHLEMCNDIALGEIHRAQGRFAEADQAFGRALGSAKARGDDRNRLRIYVDFASLNLTFHRTVEAAGYYELARDEATRRGDLVTRMGALEGLADCHRRHGGFRAAMGLALEALSVPSLEGFSRRATDRAFAATRVAALRTKLARWYSETGKCEDARRLLAVAAQEGGASLAAGLVVEADLLFDEKKFDRVEPLASRAVALARELDDLVVLTAARTTLGVLALRDGRFDSAGKEIRRLSHYPRPRGGSLIIPAMSALVERGLGRASRAAFEALHDEARERIGSDSDDFAAYDFLAFALCGLALDGAGGLESAVAAVRDARAAQHDPAPALVDRMVVLVEALDATGRPRGQLRPVLAALPGG
ncbi:hypothetical protein JIG36_48620 [Actinoplanes sp. LDG1-06]|uniref:Uncharacterized protein n=1 Tax=Paractinoplanes ovalisporus TaxID=2810368 RepID=A0ABS2AU91_9ACTN|nr:hypothetical protein [Actinoplanes ovalisporus]MBM2623386.1 hypothetical protein [Actinoplanes ovalisporus]